MVDPLFMIGKKLFLSLFTLSVAAQAQARGPVANIDEIVVTRNPQKGESKLDVSAAANSEAKMFIDAKLYRDAKEEKLRMYKDLAKFILPSPQFVVRVYVLDKTIVGVALNNEYHDTGDRRMIRFSSDWISGK